MTAPMEISRVKNMFGKLAAFQ